MNNSNVENIFLSDLKQTQNVLKTKSSKLLNEYLLKKNSINEKEKITNEIQEIRNLKSNFLSQYIYNIYQKVTEDFSKYLRVEELILQVELQFPYLLPEKELIEFDKSKIQKDKIGFEFDYGIFFNSILSNEKCGNHLIHSMLLPKKQSIELLKKFRNEDKIDLGTALITRKNGISTVWFNNPRFLHAEDETTIKNVETAIDLALLDEKTKIGILRGSKIKEGKYAGKHTSCTGINLTHLYNGKITYLWYLI